MSPIDMTNDSHRYSSRCHHVDDATSLFPALANKQLYECVDIWNHPGSHILSKLPAHFISSSVIFNIHANHLLAKFIWSCLSLLRWFLDSILSSDLWQKWTTSALIPGVINLESFRHQLPVICSICTWGCVLGEDS